MTTRARREREKQERRQSILSAAREVFFEQGFHRATVDAVARQAEVSKGTVYLYFDSKETLLAVLLLEGLQKLFDEIETAYAPALNVSAADRLRALSRAYIRFFQNDPQYFRLMMAMDRGQFRDAVTPEIYQQVLETSLECLSWVTRAVDQGTHNGEFGCCDTRQAAATLWATLNGVLELMDHSLRRDLIGVTTEELCATAVETVIRGLRRPPQSPIHSLGEEV